MKTWKSKLFGDNRFNFYSWICAGLFVIGVSLWCAIRAVSAGALEAPESLLLLAIYFILLGRFGLALQSYHARVAERLDSEERKKDDDAT